MSEPMPEPTGAGNILTRKYAGVPGYVWLAGALIIGYLFLRNRSGTSSTPANSTPSNAQSTFGNVTLPSQGAITVNFTNPTKKTVTKPKPKPPPKKPINVHKPPHKPKTKTTSGKEPED